METLAQTKSAAKTAETARAPAHQEPIRMEWALVTNLEEFGATLLIFGDVEGVVPTNIAAGHSIRRGAHWRVRSSSSASEAGSRLADRMLNSATA